jgi:hypothetical protein
MVLSLSKATTFDQEVWPGVIGELEALDGAWH